MKTKTLFTVEDLGIKENPFLELNKHLKVYFDNIKNLEPKHRCPNCGATVNKNICDYCGT